MTCDLGRSGGNMERWFILLLSSTVEGLEARSGDNHASANVREAEGGVVDGAMN